MGRTTDIFVPAPGPGTDGYLIFSCGHVTHPIMLKQMKKKSTCCPVCKAPIAYKIFTCQMCGKHLKVSSKASSCKFCISCRKIEARLYQRRNAIAKLLPLPVKDAPKPLSAKDRSVKPDCKWYLLKCLPEAAFKPGGRGKVHCKGCPDYTPAPLHANVDGYGNGLIAPNQGCVTNWHL